MKMNKTALSIVGVLIVSLVGCGGSGSGSGTPQERPSGSIGGKAVDAILVNATIRAYEWENGTKKGSVIAETQTDSTGAYELNPKFKDAYLLLEATSGRYIEEATGTTVTLEEGQTLTALVRYESGSALTTHITVATHWAACQAEWRATTQNFTDTDAVDVSNDLFSVLVGVPIREIEPLNITNPNNASPVLNAGLRYGLFSAAISSLTKTMAEESGQDAHGLTSTTSIHLAQIGCNDIRADGKLNGLGYTPATPTAISQLSFGTVQLSPELFRTRLAQEMLAIASSPLNKSGLDASDYFVVADSLSQMDSALFDNIAPVSADITGPTIGLDLAENTYLNNTVLFNFDINDPLGVKLLDFYLDDVYIGSGTAGNTALNINTASYMDGEYVVKVVATDFADNSTTFTRTFNFSNGAPVVAMTSPLLVNNRTYTASGTFAINGSPISSITANGVEADIDTDTNTWEATLSLNSGNNTVTLAIEDDIGNQTSFTLNVGVDLNKPVISVNSTITTFTTFQGQLNLCTFGELDDDTASGTPICLSTDNLSLDGASIRAGLASDGFALLSYSPRDPQAAGVFTSIEDLTIEYRFLKDGVEKFTWTSAPIDPSWGATHYFPMVTEYLGNDWYQGGTSSNNNIQIRVTDTAGNFIIQEWNVLIDVLVPAIAVTAETTNAALFTNANYSTRSSVDGQLVNVEYLLTNPSRNAYYISMNDAQNHRVMHTVETKVRKNRARIRTNYDWRGKFMIGELYNCAAPPFGSICSTRIVEDANYTPVSRLYYGIGSGSVSKPTNTVTAYAEYQTDSIPTSSTGYTSKSSLCVNYTPPAAYASTTLHQTSDIRSKALCINSGGTLRSNLQERVTQSVENQSGYPRNETTDTVTNLGMLSERVTVFDDNLGQEISPTSSWYKVPPLTTIKIIKSIRTPVILHETDAEVAQGTFTSYSSKRLDSMTTWLLDTDIDITRAIDPGDIALINNVTHFTENFGNGIETYTIGR